MSGHRAYRGRGRVAPAALIVMLLVIIAGAVLVVMGLKKDKGPTPPADDQDPIVDVDPAQTPDPDPQPDPIAKIEPQGEIKKYDAVYCVGNTGYEMYTYVDSTAQKYAQCINKAADELMGSARVFDLVIPLSSGITLPDELYGQDFFSDQKAAETSILGYLDGATIPVPLYDALMQHRTEYIYYRTDHHWTGLGAYYAYAEFCKAAGLTANALSAYRTLEMPGFLGTFYNDTGKSAVLGDTPDTVTGYYPLAGDMVTMTVYNESGAKVVENVPVVFDETSAPAAYKYGAYIYGDNAYTVITNTAKTDGSSCLVVKESFGNAFVPFLADHYQTVYVIDYRHWSGSISGFVKENGVGDVVFCNNLSAIRNSSLVSKLYGIL